MRDASVASSRLRLALDAGIVGAFLLLALAPWDVLVSQKIDLVNMLGPPSSAHPLGTDNLGRDLLGRLAAAVRGGVLPLWGGVLVGCMAGGTAALVAIVAQARGPLARGATAVVDALTAALASIPVGLLAFAWAAWQERAGLLPVLGSLSGLFAARTYLELRDLHRRDVRLGYWTAHAALGGSLWQRVTRYGLLSGWLRPLATTLGFHLRAAVAIEASLSYLGFGLQEPQASFGNMLASHFDLYLKGHWSVLAAIVACLAATAAFPASVVRLADAGQALVATRALRQRQARHPSPRTAAPLSPPAASPPAAG
jgi:peptide/nickel transport system permease protein